MPIKIEMLRCFATVAQTGNLAEAAARLGRTQSAISMTLKQLEDNLGQRLFKSDRKNHLTPLGAQVLELAQAQLQQFDNTILAIKTSANAPRGLIRIASIPSVAGLVMPSAIQGLTSRYPGLKVELRDTDTAQVVDALQRGQADIGIVSGPHSLNGVRQAALFDDPFGVICSPDHALIRQKPTPEIKDIISATFIRNDLCQMIKTPGFRAAITGCKVTVHNTTSLLAMVRTGNWLTVLPQTVRALAPNDLVFRPIADLPDRRQVCVLLREKTLFPEICEVLWQYLISFNWTADVG